MKKSNLYKLIIVTLLIFSCQEDTIDYIEKGSITGRIVTADSFDPIENAKVTLSPTSNSVFSDSEGYFEFIDIEEGEYSVSALKEDFLTDFQPATVDKDVVVNLIFEMEVETAFNEAPSTPVLLAPENDSVELENSVMLTWEAKDEDEDDILVYSLFIYNDYDSSILEVQEISEPSFQLNDLRHGVKYFWQIGVSDNINEMVLSEVFNFTVKVNPENRFTFVRTSENGNNIIYSANISDSDQIVNEVQLTSNEYNSWRPRKNNSAGLIAFLGIANNEVHIFTMELNGSNVQQVTNFIPVSGFNFNEMDFAWSDNGDRLLYSNFDTLYEINKDGSGLRIVYEVKKGAYISEVAWSSDESIIALKTNDLNGYNSSIFTIDQEGNELNSILSEVNGAVGGLEISVDNNYLLYSYDVSGFETASYRRLDSRVFLYNLNTDEVNDLSDNKQDGTNDLDPRFSPNEAEVIFVNTSNDGVSQQDIFTVQITNSNIRNKIIPDAFMPDWE